MSDCDKLRAAGYTFECCPSCHDDYEEYGVEMCNVYWRDERLHVCCRAADAVPDDETALKVWK